MFSLMRVFVVLLSLCVSKFGSTSEMETDFILTKYQKMTELSGCAAAILSLDNATRMEISVQRILDTFDHLDTLAGAEITYYQGLLDNLTTASIYDVDLRHVTLEQISDVTDDISHNDEGAGNDSGQSCVLETSGEQEPDVPVNWRELSVGQRYRKDSWVEGVYRYSKFNVCPGHVRCSIASMVVLPDGSLAVSDIRNYEIRVFSMQGTFLRKYDLIPLYPTYMTHFRDYKVFTRMKNLNGNYVIAEIDLWEMTSRTLIEFAESFPWEYACSAPFAVVKNTIFVGCTPYLFVYDVNGTRLRNYTTTRQQLINVYHSEGGSDRVLMSSPPMADTFDTDGISVFSALNISNGPICSTTSWVKTGAMSSNGTFYLVNMYEQNRVIRMSPDCRSEGMLLDINVRHKFETLAVYGDLLIGQVEGKWRRRSGNMLHVYRLVDRRDTLAREV